MPLLQGRHKLPGRDTATHEGGPAVCRGAVRPLLPEVAQLVLGAVVGVPCCSPERHGQTCRGSYKTASTWSRAAVGRWAAVWFLRRCDFDWLAGWWGGVVAVAAVAVAHAVAWGVGMFRYGRGQGFGWGL